jgi:hypothetical protein
MASAQFSVLNGQASALAQRRHLNGFQPVAFAAAGARKHPTALAMDRLTNRHGMTNS